MNCIKYITIHIYINDICRKYLLSYLCCRLFDEVEFEFASENISVLIELFVCKKSDYFCYILCVCKLKRKYLNSRKNVMYSKCTSHIYKKFATHSATANDRNK